MTEWVVVGVETRLAWPEADTEVEYEGHKLTLRPGTADLLHCVLFKHPPEMTFEDAHLVIRRFLSSLAWVEGSSITEEAVSGGGFPIKLGRYRPGNPVTRTFRVDYLPLPAGPRAQLALAFYREALGLNSIPYQFLGFFKIINILYDRGPQQTAWINAVLPKITDHHAKERLAEISTLHVDLGAYLYASGRCAVAHAFQQPLVDPDNIEDTSRLRRDLPVIKALADYAIEIEFGVKSQHTVWKEHLYHLEGFKTIFAPGLIEKLRSGTQIDVSDFPNFPPLSIRVRDMPQLASFANLTATAELADGSILWIRCRHPAGTLEAILGLDLAAEELDFDPQESVAVSGEESLAALAAQRDTLVLLGDLLGNGELEVLRADTGERLGRTDPYIGVNINLGASLTNIAARVTVLEQRIRAIAGA